MYQGMTKLTEHLTRNDEGFVVPTRDNIVEIARRCIGIPWRHQGRTMKGMDCIGIIIAIGHLTGTHFYNSTANYRRAPRPEVFLADFRKELNEKPLHQRKHGDVILIRDAIFTTHSGIYTTDGDEETLIHAFALRKQVVEDPISNTPQGSYLYNRMTHCFEYKGVID
jgi:cell wall-associated NlpC family hydrolase